MCAVAPLVMPPAHSLPAPVLSFKNAYSHSRLPGFAGMLEYYFFSLPIRILKSVITM